MDAMGWREFGQRLNTDLVLGRLFENKVNWFAAWQPRNKKKSVVKLQRVNGGCLGVQSR